MRAMDPTTAIQAPIQKAMRQLSPEMVTNDAIPKAAMPPVTVARLIRETAIYIGQVV